MTGTTAAPKHLLRVYTAFAYLFLYLPVVVLIVFSFNDAKTGSEFTEVSLQWYEKAWNDDAAWRAGKMTMLLSLATVSSSLVLGTAAAVGLRYTGARLQRVIWPLLLLPVVLPEIAMAAAFLKLYGFLGVDFSFYTVWFAHVAFSVSYVVVVVQARLAGMDHALEEAAADLGAPPLTAFFTVTLPQLMPAVASAAMLVFALSIDDYVITSFVSGAGNTTVPVYLYSLLRKGITPKMHAISTLLLLVTTPLIIGSWLFEQRGKK